MYFYIIFSQKEAFSDIAPNRILKVKEFKSYELDYKKIELRLSVKENSSNFFQIIYVNDGNQSTFSYGSPLQ